MKKQLFFWQRTGVAHEASSTDIAADGKQKLINTDAKKNRFCCFSKTICYYLKLVFLKIGIIVSFVERVKRPVNRPLNSFCFCGKKEFRRKKMGSFTHPL